LNFGDKKALKEEAGSTLSSFENLLNGKTKIRMIEKKIFISTVLGFLN
jgi:hypothetical protein